MRIWSIGQAVGDFFAGVEKTAMVAAATAAFLLSSPGTASQNIAVWIAHASCKWPNSNSLPPQGLGH